MMISMRVYISSLMICSVTSLKQISCKIKEQVKSTVILRYSFGQESADSGLLLLQSKYFCLVRIKSKVASKYSLSSQPRLVDIIAAVPPEHKKVMILSSLFNKTCHRLLC